MAKKDNRYIQFYTPGSAAVKVEIRDEREWAPLPEVRRVKPIVIPVDPVAIVSFAVAVCMLLLMAVSINRLNTTRREVAALEHYVAGLTAENRTLTETYTSGYDIDVVHQKALDMGMVPAEEVKLTHIYVTLPPAEEEEPITVREQITVFLEGLFA